MERVGRGTRKGAVVRLISGGMLLAVLGWIVASGFAGSAMAQGEQRGRSWARKFEIDALTGKRLSKANLLLADQLFDEADAVLDKMRIRSLNANEKTKLYSLRGFVALGREDFAAAREFFELTIAQDFLEIEKQADLRFVIARICLQQDKWDEAIANLNKWFTIEKEPNSSAYYLLALAYW